MEFCKTKDFEWKFDGAQFWILKYFLSDAPFASYSVFLWFLAKKSTKFGKFAKGEGGRGNVQKHLNPININSVLGPKRPPPSPQMTCCCHLLPSKTSTKKWSWDKLSDLNYFVPSVIKDGGSFLGCRSVIFYFRQNVIEWVLFRMIIYLWIDSLFYEKWKNTEIFPLFLKNCCHALKWWD